MDKSLTSATHWFPFWTVLGAGLAFLWPWLFTWFSGPLIVWGLAGIMLGMGITLNLQDFRDAIRMPRPLLLGVGAQFSIMPLCGWSLAVGLQLPSDFAVGLILVSCCPGGTASNVVTYLARANLALSVLMTIASTFAAVAMTPLLTKLLAGKIVPVDAWGLFRDIVQIVLLPVLAGVALNRWTPKLVGRVQTVAPLIAVAIIVLIVSSIIGQRAEELARNGGRLLLAVFLLHAFAFSLGYLTAWLFGFEDTIRRTTSIEVGMQNSGLGATLAKLHFNASTATSCAVSAVMHCLIGSAMAGYWRWRSARHEDKAND